MIITTTCKKCADGWIDGKDIMPDGSYHGGKACPDCQAFIDLNMYSENAEYFDEEEND